MLDLPQEILDNYNKSIINNSTINEIIFIKDQKKQLQIVKKALEKKLTVREIRKIARENNNSIYDCSDYPLLNKDIFFNLIEYMGSTTILFIQENTVSIIHLCP
jgi:HTH domain found in ParB protein